MKGISPLIAAVLLIAFTVSIATIILGWFSSYVRTTSENVTSQTQETVGCSVAGVTIEHVYLNVSGNAKIVVKNTGFKDLTTVSGLIAGTDGTTCDLGSITLGKGEVGTITGTCSLSSCTKFERAVVTTECGGVGDTVTGTSYCDDGS